MNDTPESPRQSPEQSARRSPDPATITTLLGPKSILATQRQGWRATVAGEHVRTCPYTGPDERTQALRLMWVRGYAAGLTDLRSARATTDTAAEDARQSPDDASPPTVD